MKQVPITYETSRMKYKAKNASECLFRIFEEHNRKIKELVGQEYAPGTARTVSNFFKAHKSTLSGSITLPDINIEK
jgi:hypothetical protein